MTAIRVIDDHLELASIGINTHDQIDNHITDDTIHFTEASISHLNIADIGNLSYIDIDNFLDQAVKVASEPTFAGLTVDNININGRTYYSPNGSLIFQTYYGNIYLTALGDDEAVVVNKDLDVLQSIFVGYEILHKGDTNTKIRFLTDQIDFYAGGWRFLSLDEGTYVDKITFNPDKRDINFMVNGDNIGGLISVDAGYDFTTFGGGMSNPPKSVTGDYQALYSDHLIYCSSANPIALTLPDTGIHGQEVIIVNRGNQNVTITPMAGTERISGAVNQVLAVQYDSITIRADKGVGWYITADTR